MIGRIDAAAGISIDVPGAAQLVVFLDDGVGNAEPAERDAQRDRAHAGADDQHMLLRQGLVGRTLGPTRFARNKSHFLAHQRRIFRRDVLAEAGAHHLQHQFVAGIGDGGLGLAVCEQLEDGGADFVLDLLRHAGLGIGDQADIALGLVGWFQPAFIAGHVNQHHQQERMSPSAMAEARSSFLRGISMFMTPLGFTGRFHAIHHRHPTSSLR